MGALLHHEDFAGGRLRTEWYFNSFGFSRWYEDMKVQYPVMLSVHHDAFLVEGTRVKIRRFVRDRLVGDVFVTTEDRTYQWLDRSDRSMSHVRGTISHGYTHFHFETDEDATIFSMYFSDIVSRVTNRHPTKHVPEEMIKDAENCPYYGIWE